MRIVIAGGTGLIGSALVKLLSNEEHELVILSRNPEKYRNGEDEGVSFEQCDAAEQDSWDRQIDGAQIIVNFAGENLAGDKFLPARWTESKKLALKQSRLDTGSAIARAIANAKNKPDVLIQASAVGYYGPRGSEEISESVPAGDDYLARLCVDWEQSTAGVAEIGVRRVILRTGLVLSTEGGPLPRLLKQFRLFGGGPFGSGHQYWPWIHLDDVIGAIRFLMMNSKARGPFNITSPTPVTNKQFSKQLGRALHRPSFWPIPAFAMRLLLGEVAVVVLTGQRAVPSKLLDLGYKYQYLELGSALADLVN
ncbi:MAG: TIGR01777 family oxidoreductase [Candidatus Promineifilaceae bacterium]